MALSSAPCTPKILKGYVDDTFTILRRCFFVADYFKAFDTVKFKAILTKMYKIGLSSVNFSFGCLTTYQTIASLSK